MLYIKLFIEREKNTGQSAPECPFNCDCNFTFRLSFGQTLTHVTWGGPVVGVIESNRTAARKTTYDLVVGDGAAGVGRGHGGGAVFGVPRRLELLRGAADRQRVDAVRVSVTVAVVSSEPSVTRCPHVDDTPSTSTLSHHITIFVYLFASITFAMIFDYLEIMNFFYYIYIQCLLKSICKY